MHVPLPGCRFPGLERSWTEATIPAPDGYSTSGRLLAATVLVLEYTLAALPTDAAIAFEQVSLPRVRR